ncbi:hypothetical protein BU25DRAFT_459583 [Macroventuria anomochaeta]|uniref:Uncharacterized protein n=1 Tax=Macroventuria anomochaeta TaxID=301207 RepID=A0ACB6RWW9_9PLEO|nr:uncharacterized protein BU25DRAFT_459583 [Macroventuria anomochaeta]KAF2626460.1 hypothetical protein BU25DRAFT_459583 [Macroventuria anomochaeta]
MFALGVLSEIEGVEEVKLVGLPLWFTRCLSLQMADQGGTVSELTWPTKTVKRQQDEYHKPKKVETTSRKYWQPMLIEDNAHSATILSFPRLGLITVSQRQRRFSGESLTNID